jgi:amino acid transporter/nucleotide-binding universal stress UspA family protein
MKLSRDLGVFSVTMIGVGAMIGAGIFVLTGIAAGVAGPAVLVAFLLNGIVAVFTASAYAELGSSIPEAGGGYLWVKESLPQPSGFLSGWMSWMAHSVACSLYAVGFGAYFGELLTEFHVSLTPSAYLEKRILACGLVLLFGFINYRGAKETGKAGNIVTVLKIGILFLFIIIGSRVILGEPQRMVNFFPFFPKGFLGILTAMGLTYIAFEGYEIIAQSGEEIKNPEKNIRRAIFYSLIIVVPIYILVGFVALGVVNPGNMSAWAFLAQGKEIALVDAARSINRWGSLVLLAGGLLSTVSALNATIYSSSRVSFAMGRDNNLPPAFSRIHGKFKTPSGAIALSGVLIIIMILALPIQDIASSADVMFLFLFIFVNVALIHTRRKKPNLLKGYRSPLFPLFPVLGILTQSVLMIVMFLYSAKSFFISLLWIGAGLSIYYGYARLREKEVTGPKVLLEEKELAHKDYRLVLGVERQREVAPLMNLAIPLARERDGEIFVTHVIRLPPQTPLNVGKRFVEERKKFLLAADTMGEEEKVPVSFNIRTAHRIYLGILDSVVENKGSLLVVGAGKITARGKILGEIHDPLRQETPGDVGILHIKGDKAIKNILIPTSGGPNARLAFEWGSVIAKQNRGKLTLLSVVPDEAGKEEAQRRLDETKKGVPFEKERVHDEIAVGHVVLEEILRKSEGYDLVIIGASKESLWKRLRFGTITEKVTRSSSVSTLIVRKYEGVILSWIRRFLSG